VTESTVLDRLLALLDAAGASYVRTSHRPVFTSADAAEARGSSLHSGAKALVMKHDEGYVMAVIPADLALEGVALRKHLGSRRLRFATKEELLELTGLAPGSVPPFGSLFGLRTVCDTGLAENEQINFNAGSHSESLRIAYSSYTRVEKPEVLKIARAETGE
jgi:Ala-tRNA(Pro) deacylase